VTAYFRTLSTPRYHVFVNSEDSFDSIGTPKESDGVIFSVFGGFQRLLRDSLGTPSGLLEDSFRTPFSERLLQRLLSGLLSTLL
jgi:hypothetical protein